MKQLVLRPTAPTDRRLGAVRHAKRPIRVLLIQPPARHGVRPLLPQLDEHGGEGIGLQTAARHPLLRDHGHAPIERSGFGDRRKGITVLAYFMFGNLGETRDDMTETTDFALGLDADCARFSITIPYASAEMYDEALKRGIITADYWVSTRASRFPISCRRN